MKAWLCNTEVSSTAKWKSQLTEDQGKVALCTNGWSFLPDVSSLTLCSPEIRVT